jgi:hypothetical protein
MVQRAWGARRMVQRMPKVLRVGTKDGAKGRQGCKGDDDD